MHNLDVTDIHYDKKISDLQRRLDTQYDKIDEVEEAIADLKSQVYELKKNQIDADSIYGFLKVFNLYIAQVKAKYGIIERENYNKSKSDEARQSKCSQEKEEAIVDAMEHFKMI